MADIKISALGAANALTGTELMVVVQGGVTKRTTAAALTGPQGAEGATGATGAAGAAGAAGSDGKTVLYGVAAPTAEGVDGDFYINTATNYIYGPKAAGVWPAGTSLVGPAGAQGEQGIQGLTGATGDTGATGADGSMTGADKTKLDGIAAGAEVNVNADWSANSGDAQILNKPTLGTAAAAATTDFDAAGAAASALSSANSHSDGLVVGLWDDRGSFDAGVNTYPTTGGSGTAGAILKGDIWTISVVATAGVLNGYAVGTNVRAVVDTPGQTGANWAVTEVGLGYVPENAANKRTSFQATPDDTHYASEKLVKDSLDAKVAANPTGTISGSAVNGSASTFMRSDAAPALNLTIAQLNTAVSDADLAILGANTFTGQQTFAETVDTIYNITDGAAFEIDPVNGNIQTITLGASRTPAATNFAAGQCILLGINDGTAYAITWTSVAVTWIISGGTATAPALATTGYTWVLLWKVGTTIYGTLVGSP